MVTRSWCQGPGACRPGDNSGKRGWWAPSTRVRSRSVSGPQGLRGQRPAHQARSQALPYQHHGQAAISTRGHRPSRSVFLTLSRSPQRESGADPGCGSGPRVTLTHLPSCPFNPSAFGFPRPSQHRRRGQVWANKGLPYWPRW